MTTLNRGACDAMLESSAHAATDVTGFGLLGHLRNLALASGLSATIFFDRVPVLAAARRYVRAGVAPGGTHANRRYLDAHVHYAPDVEREDQLLLADAQTSGGLLIAVAERDVDALVRALERHGAPASAVVGRLEAGKAGTMRVERGV
jgi:selenide,water dikinase